MNEIKLNLLPFTHTSGGIGRYALESVFWKDGFAYATNGHYAARYPMEKPSDEIPAINKTPDMSRVFPKEEIALTRFKITPDSLPTKEQLDDHLLTAPCECAMNINPGRCECEHCDDVHDCGLCDGTSEVQGDRWFVGFMERAVNWEYLAEIIALANKVNWGEMDAGTSETTPHLFFTIDYYEIVLMPGRAPLKEGEWVFQPEKSK